MEKQATTIWQFPKIAPVKQREGFYCKESMIHPAKMPTYLAQAIILTYTKESDLILDPMAGIGTTVIEAVKLGRNAIGIEYEKKFVKLCNKNLALTTAKLNKKIGKGLFIRGDARELSRAQVSAGEVVDSVIFSPPFANTLAGSSSDNIKKYRHGSAGKDYGDKKDQNQIGNLRHNRIDRIIFSPPYEEGIGHTCRLEANKLEAEKRLHNAYSVNSSENLGNQRGKTYMSEMFKVYQECYNVLKHNSLMVLVVKNFRRRGEEINLVNDTIRLCKLAGFNFFQTCIHVLNSASFWQINHTKKTPFLMLNLTEYILVFKKTQ